MNVPLRKTNQSKTLPLGWGLSLLAACLTVAAFAPVRAQTASVTASVTAAKKRASVKLSPERPVVMTAQTLKPVTLGELTGEKATVLVFTGIACPISNEYAPELRALNEAYAAKGVRFVFVYSNAGTMQHEAQNHVSTFYNAPIGVWDNRQDLANAIGATTTPEVAVLDETLTLRYRGRIDDRYVARAKSKTAGPQSRDLTNALNAVLAGKPVPVATTRATGCLIERGSNPAPKEPVRTAADKPAAAPTFAEDIAPIIQQNCQSCHRAGEIGPMPLENYEQIRRYAANIVAVTESKFMPPWKPLEGHGEFQNKRTLTDEQIATIKRWADAGAPVGDLKKMPTPPKFSDGWQLGTPDLVLTMPEKWRTEASGNDIYRCFVLPTNLKEDKQVVAVEYRAGNKRVVHHVLGYIDVAGEGRKQDAREEGPGYTNFGGPGFLPFGELGGWAPGNMPAFLPDGVGRKLPAGSDVVIQVHYHPTGKVEEDITQVGLYFADKPVEKQLRVIPVAYPRLNIPPGEQNYRVEATMPILADVKALFVTPHMHLLGREIEMWVTLPDGQIKPMVKINDWDFRWQDNYSFQKPMQIPKGSKVTLRARYDNSTNNPRNPHNPPQPVKWGEGTNDEMCIGFIGFIADNENDPLIKLMDGLRQRRKGEPSNAAEQKRAAQMLEKMVTGNK
ncbi:MAG: thioredoxin family protein [Armatimonadaceae bacterium]